MKFVTNNYSIKTVFNDFRQLMVIHAEKIIFSVFLLFSLAVATAQQPVFTNQQHYGVEDGLPQSFVSGIVQDEDGFIWIATLDGLCRYDGRGFITIHHDPKDSTSLAANVIEKFGRLQNNTIAIYYSQTQADNFNLRTFKASRYKIQEQLNKISSANWQDNKVGFGTANFLFLMENQKGMSWLNSKSGKVYYANQANGLLQQDTICAIAESKEGKLFLVSENGVQVSNKSRSKFEWIPFATNVKKGTPGGLYNERYSIVCLSAHRLAIAGQDKIILLDIDQKTSKIVMPPAPSKVQVFSANSQLQVDSKGRAYFENTGRIFMLTENGELRLLWENTSNLTLRITAFFIDRSDVLWLSVNAQGLLKIDLQASLFKSYKYQGGFVTDILAQAGVNRGGILKPQTYTEASFSFRHAWDTKGKLFLNSTWLGDDKIYQLSEGRLCPFSRYPRHTLYTAMLTMPDDAIWAFDQLSLAWYSWKNPSSVPEKLELEKESMKGIGVTDAWFMGGYIWVATDNNGLLQYQGTKRINKFAGKLPSGIMPETLTEICPDPVNKNRFWIGSHGGGLILWDLQKGLQRIYTTDDGLPNNTIYCILPGRAGKIWCSTNKGIFRFDAETGQVRAFEKTDGLPGNEFNRAHTFAFPDGRLAFGGLEGYTIFNPADFDTNPKSGAVPVMLTGLHINNHPQDVTVADRIIKEPLSTLSRIELPYNKNYLRFAFSAMLFNQPQKTKYRFQLKGVDEHWVENGTSNIASYSALVPGSYTLLLNATDNNGLWSTTVKKLQILIRPPLWATWWAYVLYALMALGIVKWYFQFRERQLKTAQSLATEKREAMRLREMEEVKDRFFSNIAHEFRTPLTLIVAPLEKLGKDPSLSAASGQLVASVQKNSKQLLKLINEFLDFAKLNDGQMKLDLSAGDLLLFVKDVVQPFEAGASEKNINLTHALTGIEGLYLFDDEKWEKILANLLSNALKFTPPGGRVSVLVSALEDAKIELQVTNTGPGIPKDQQDKIFDRFYQVDDSAIRNHGGTGIGLSLVKELTELMKGTIHLFSQPGVLTTFTLVIPVQKVQGGGPTSDVMSLSSANVLRVMGNGDKAPVVMVVEDNVELRHFLAESLQLHYQVIQAGDGLNAWEIILQELPDVIISDVMMPGKDGFELCHQCKSDIRTSHISFVLLTSKAAHEARLKGLATGADDYITKPFHLDEMEQRIANLLHHQQKTREHLQSQLMLATPGETLPTVNDAFLKELYKEMDAQLDDPDMGVDYLCKAVSMSRSTLNRKLRSLLDISTNDFIQQYRLQKAAGLLSAGHDITSAAYKVGFSSPSYFTQCFKQQFGTTPSDYLSKSTGSQGSKR